MTCVLCPPPSHPRSDDWGEGLRKQKKPKNKSNKGGQAPGSGGKKQKGGGQAPGSGGGKKQKRGQQGGGGGGGSAKKKARRG